MSKLIQSLSLITLFFSSKAIAMIPDRCDWQDYGSSESTSIIAIIVFIVIVIVIIIYNAKTK